MESKYNLIFIYKDKKQLIDLIEEEFIKKFNISYEKFIKNRLNQSFNILHNNLDNVSEGPVIVLYFDSVKCKNSNLHNDLISKTMEKGYFLVPIIGDDSVFKKTMPKILHNLNAFKWEGENPQVNLNKIIFDNLGLNDKDRRVFISYKRSDGSGMADQLLNILTRQKFDVFLDRYNIDYGSEIEKKIFQSIDDKAFLIILESPEANQSNYISKEVNYALKHGKALLIISFPGVETEIENTKDLPRFHLKKNNIVETGSYNIIKNDILEDLILKIESIHADGLNRRRNLLIRSIELEMRKKYESVFYIDNWVLVLKNPRNQNNNRMISITPRIPESLDLYKLDQIKYKNNEIERILCYQAENVPDIHVKMLNWIIEEKLNLKILNYIYKIEL